MKQLYLVRHAKSDWGNSGASDFERELNERGLRDAPAMGRWLATQSVKPRIMLSSPARRALHTAEMLAEGMGFPTALIFHEPRIYEAHTGALQEIIEESDDSIDSLMLVGHNPAMTQLVNTLSGKRVDNLPTCSIAALQFDVTRWAQLSNQPANACEIWRPKEVLR